MTINEHLSTFGGRVVKNYDDLGQLKEPKKYAVRVSLSYDEFNDDGLYWEDKLDKVLADPMVEQLESMVIGTWEDVGSQDSEFIIELLVDNKDKLKNLQELFIGDIVMEESECSWIDHGDMSPLFSAFPKLTHLAIRGCGGLNLDPIEHQNLRSLVIQCGGLPHSVIQSVVNAKLPNLEHLELWLGEENYGGEFELDDLRPFMFDSLFPKLIYLGLKNSEVEDGIAEMIAQAPIIKQIKVLDLSMGTLSDKGGEALLACPGLKNLEFIDLHHHYMSEAMMDRFRALGVQICLDDRQEDELNDDEVWRFISVSE